MTNVTQRLISLLLIYVVIAISNISLSPAHANNELDWDQSGYKVHIHLAANSKLTNSTQLASRISQYLLQRIDATLFPFWTSDIFIADGTFRYQLLNGLDSLPSESISETTKGSLDKTIYLSVQPTSLGYVLNCREYDKTLQEFGPVLTQHVNQSSMLDEHCFRLICQTFSPLAKVRRIEEDPKHVALHLKGHAFTEQANHPLFTNLNDVYQPMRIRLTRSGEIREGGIAAIPWTFLSTENIENPNPICRIHSAIQHPFGVRRRGRVEYIAKVMRHPAAATQVRFHAQHEKSQSLIGYEVFGRVPDSEESYFIGFTNREGEIDLASSSSRLTTVFLRSSGALLAKVPIVSGVSQKIEIPIADDIARLNAQANLTATREQLVDLVARRNILIARVRDSIEASDYDQAQKLLSQLDEFPGRAQFAQSISSAQNSQRNRSSEPRIQAKIDKMYNETLSLLGKFLDTRTVSELHNELKAARTSGTEPKPAEI